MNELLETLDLICNLKLSFDEFYFGNGLVIYPGTENCNLFLNKFPRYKWLQLQELGTGYYQNLDTKGNCVAVMYRNAKYSDKQLIDTVNNAFRDRLAEHGEQDFFAFTARKAAVQSLKQFYGSKKALCSVVKSSLQSLDKLGIGWGIYGQGSYFKDVFADVLQENNFRNLVGLFGVPKDLERHDPSFRKNLFKARYLVMAIPSREARETAAVHLLSDENYCGEMLDFDSLLRSSKIRKSLEQVSVEEMIDFIRIMVPGERRRKIKRTVCAMGLYPLAKKIRDLMPR